MISQRAKNINPSPTLAITAKAKEMKKNGIDVVSFGAGEPDFDTPSFIKKGAIEAINQGFTKYTATSGIPELKKAICDKFKKDNGLDYTPANILVSNGAKQSLYNIIQVLINTGDEVIVPIPYWVSYEEMVKLAGGKCVFLKTKNFKIKPENLLKNITKKTKLFILNSPSNPTGAVYDKKELEDIAKICVNKNIYVLSDEIYENLIYGKKHISIASLNEKIKKLTIVINGVSKSYSMTGWRIGYAGSDDIEVIKAASALQDHSTSNPNSIAQKAALAALLGDQGFLKGWVAEYQKRRDFMVDYLNTIEGINAAKPDAAFYVFVNMSKFYGKAANGSVDFCRKLLERAHVAVIPGAAFGDDDYVRLSFATSMENIKKGLERIKNFTEEIRKKV